MNCHISARSAYLYLKYFISNITKKPKADQNDNYSNQKNNSYFHSFFHLVFLQPPFLLKFR